jgi:hypothetical protein
VSQLIWANAVADKTALNLLLALRQHMLPSLQRHPPPSPQRDTPPSSERDTPRACANSTLADLSKFSAAALVHVAWAAGIRTLYI